MALFPKDQSAESVILGNAPRRMAWTREKGTRKLLAAFLVFIGVWWGFGRIRDTQLLAKRWSSESPEANGLTVVGTLDSRGSLGRNLFHVIEANSSSRPELTDFGWRSLFDGHSALFSDRAGNTIRATISLDSKTGFRMLEPYMRVGVARLMGKPDANLVTADTPITVQEGGKEKTVRLQVLLDKYAKLAAPSEGGSGGGGSSDEGSSLGERDVEHGIAIPAENLIQVCPVVLVGKDFLSADVEERDEPVFQRKTYTINLYLTDEGRSRFFQWSHDHVNERMVFVLNNEVITAGNIRMTMNVDKLEIGPMRDKVAAEKIAAYLNGKRK